jgi:hypothetical protein
MRVVSMVAALAVLAALPLAAQQPDSSRSGSMPGQMPGRGQMHGQMGGGHMMGNGMGHAGMMGGGMMYGGMGMMAGWMQYGMGMDSSTMWPMMRNMAFMPQHLLAERESLGLTAAQVTRLQAIEQSMQSAHQAMWQQAQPHMRAMATWMWNGSQDTTSLKSDFDAASAAMSAAHWAIMNAAVAARGILTPAQQKKVQAASGTWASHWMMGRGAGGTGPNGH